jgi:hypothetical protein
LGVSAKKSIKLPNQPGFSGLLAMIAGDSASYSGLQSYEVHRNSCVQAAKMAAAIQTFALRLSLTQRAIRCIVFRSISHTRGGAGLF